MTTMIAFHEVEDGEHWAKAWQKGPGSRHEMFAELGVTVTRTFRDPGNPNSTGVLFEVSDMEPIMLNSSGKGDNRRQKLGKQGFDRQ